MMQIGESDLTYATPRTRIWKSWRILLLVILSFVLPFAGEATFWLLHKLEILQTLRPKSLKATFSITLLGSSTGGIVLAWFARKMAIQAAIRYARILASAVIVMDLLIGTAWFLLLFLL